MKITYSQLKKQLFESNNYFREVVNFWTDSDLDHNQRKTMELIGDALKDAIEAEGDFQNKRNLYHDSILELIDAIFGNENRNHAEIAADIEKIVYECIEDYSMAFECFDNILSILENTYW